MSHANTFRRYLHFYESRDLEAIAELFAEQIQLRDWNLSVVGKAAALAETRHNFESVESLRIEVLSLFESADGVAGELRILINDRDELHVVDVLRFDAEGRICQIHAYVGRGD